MQSDKLHWFLSIKVKNQATAIFVVSFLNGFFVSFL